MLRISHVMLVCWWISLSLSKESDGPCPEGSPCIPSSECHWFTEFLALGPGTLEYRDRIPKVRQAVCNQEDAKICCPGGRVRCPEGQHCVNAVNCSSHQKNVQELIKLGRGTKKYKERREQIRANTTICSGENQPKEVCCSQLTSLPLTASPQTHFECACGCRPEKIFALFITGGEATNPGTWPWMAILKYQDQINAQRNTVFCGGTLITRRHVVTAAHCLSSPELGPVDRVVLGENDLRTDYDCREVYEENCGDNCPCKKYRDGSREGGRRCFEEDQCADKAIEVSVISITEHPRFRKEGNVPFDDIAILTLEHSISLSNWIIPICLGSTDNPLPGSFVTLTGWGNTQPFSVKSSTTTASILQTLQQEVVSQTSCSKKWFGINFQDNQMCASTNVAGEAGCQGDSGGPLMRREEGRQDRWELVGITSAGPRNCGSPNPGIYTRINKEMLEWIREVVGDQLPKNVE